MALSGNFGSNVGAYWRLQLEWTATQDIGDNTSTITAKLYWMAQRSGVGAVTASSPDAVNINIDGTNSPGATASPYLQAGQKKLIRTWSRTVSHNSGGDKTASLSAYFDVNAKLSGQTIGRVSISGSADLNDIPRASTLAAAPNWTAGKDFTLAVNRASSRFSHVVTVYIQNPSGSWVEINEYNFSTSQTSRATNFPTVNNAYIFQHLATRGSAPSRVIVKTYDGAKFIGTTSRDGTITTPLASFPEGPSYFNVGNAFTVDVLWYLPEFRHTVRLLTAVGGSVLKTYTNVHNSVSFDTSSIAATLRTQMASTTKKQYVIEVSTYFEGILVRGEKHTAIEARILNSYPTFNSVPLHRDTNSATTAITGNNQIIISGKSNVLVEITAAGRALPTDGATMVRYVATLGGKSVVRNWSGTAAVTFDFGTIAAKTNQTLSIRAEDSRGASTIQTKTITMLAYDPPTLITSATRINGFEEKTLLQMKGRLSELKVGGTPKNYIVNSRFRIKDAASTIWGSWGGFVTSGFPDYTTVFREELLDNTKSFQIQFEISDRLSTTTMTRTVESGKPLIAFDEMLNAIGIGDFPSAANEIMIALQMRFAGNKWGADAGLNMANSDIRGVNGVYSHDVADNDGEGFLFLKSGRVSGSTTSADYESLRGLDGVVKFGGQNIAVNFREVHWEGAAFLHAPGGTAQSIALVRPLSQCPSGIILLWSRYVNGAAASSDWNATFIPKYYNHYAGNSGMWTQLVAANVGDTVPPVCFKYFYPRENEILGHARNGTGSETGQVLRAVLTV